MWPVQTVTHVSGRSKEYLSEREAANSSNNSFASCMASFAGGIFRKTCPEHRSFTFRLFFGGFVLNHVPMLDKDSVLNAQNICGNPINRSTETAKSPVHDHEVCLSHDRSGFVLQR